jgi:hypothetical protein
MMHQERQRLKKNFLMTLARDPLITTPNGQSVRASAGRSALFFSFLPCRFFVKSTPTFFLRGVYFCQIPVTMIRLSAS